MEAKTIAKDEAYLRQVSKEVDLSNDSYLDDIRLLEEHCSHDKKLFALASVQLGIPLRLVYLKNTTLDVSTTDLSHNEGKILINPVVISRKGHTQFWEACASCLNATGLVNRPYELTIKYYDKDKQEHIETFEGFPSTVISHELDHLDGILHIDISEQILDLAFEERQVFRKEHPYLIISKDGEFKG